MSAATAFVPPAHLKSFHGQDGASATFFRRTLPASSAARRALACAKGAGLQLARSALAIHRARARLDPTRCVAGLGHGAVQIVHQLRTNERTNRRPLGRIFFADNEFGPICSLRPRPNPNGGRSITKNFPAGISCAKAPWPGAGAHVTASTDRPIPENKAMANFVRRGEQTLDVAHAPAQGRAMAARFRRSFALRQAKPFGWGSSRFPRVGWEGGSR